MIQPWEGIVMCVDAPQETMESGIQLTGGDDTDENKKPAKGEVVLVGKPEEGKKLPFDLKPGDIIFYERYTQNKVPFQGKTYNFVKMKTIVGVVKE